MKKRLLSFLLCLAILAGQIPAAAFAAEDTPPTEPAAAEAILDEQDATETPAPAAEEEPKAPEAPAAQQPAPTGEAAPEQTPDQQPTQQPETEGSKGTEAAPTPEEQPVPPPENNVEDQSEAQPEQQPAEGTGPADANSEETEEQPGDSVVTYTITFTDELGTASDETGSEITQAAEGTLVTITAKDRAEEGLLFTAWQAPEGLELADDTEEITTFTMPGSNVELAAEYAPLPEDAEALAEETFIATGTGGGAGNPDPTVVFVDGGKSFYNNRLYYKKGDQDKNFTGNEGDYIAHYNPATGTLTLNGYSGGSISVGGVKCSDITVVLKGTNTINGSLENAVGGDITVTSSDGGTLSISKTTSGSNPAIGIETGLSASYTTGNVTIKGNAKVTINMTHNGTSTYEKAYGIFAKENITVSENASVDITCATPNNTTGGGNCNGLYAAKDVTIDTNGTIKIDVTNAGKDKDNGYSYGVYHMGTATLTKVGNMEVQWKKEGNNTRYSGGAFTRGVTFSDTDHAINEDTTNCYASYRFGTPRKVTAGNGQLTGPGVKYPNGNGKFLAGDTVNIKPNEKKSSDGTLIPFKEWTSEGVALASPTTPNTSFNVPTNDVTVTATYNPFDGAPVFTRTSDSSGTIKFKTVANPDNSEFFEYVKDGETAYNRPYSQPTTTSSASPYEYSLSVSTYYAGDIKNLEAGDYRMAVTLNGERYLSEKFTVNYTAPVTTYTVSFNANGGTGSMADVTDISGEYTLPENGFTAPDGKQFKGWATSAYGSVISGTTYEVSSDTTFYAIWESKEYSITVTDGKATIGAGSEISKAAQGTAVTLTANAAPSDKVFDKWEVVSGGITLADANSATTTFTMPASAVSVKATYKNAPHTHTYNQETVKPEALKTPADCTSNAVYFKSCSCGAISTTDTFVAMDTALGHAHGSDWKYDSTNHWHECSRCHDKKDEAAHDYGSDNVCDTCGYDKTVPHTHNLTLVAAKAATCTTAGNSAYYTCDGCDKWFEDATGSVEITDKTSVKIPAPGHTAGTEWKSDDTNHWHECTVAGCGVIIESTKSAHTAGEWIVDTPATATTAGTKHKECTVCKKVLETATIPALVKIDVAKLTVAKPVKDAKAAAATTTDTAYTVTNTVWKAADGTILTVGESFNAGTVYTVKITLKAKENNVFTADSTYNKIEGKAAKLVTAVTGHTDSVILTYTFDATEGVAYNITKGTNGVWVKGSTDTLSFTADGEYVKFTSVKIDDTVLAAENYTAAAGSTVITLKNEYLSTLAVGAHNIAIIYTDGDCSTKFTVHQHTYGAWSSDDTHHWHECTDASCPDKAASRIEKAEHTFEWKIDVPASQASTGTKHEECTVCGKKRNENTVIDKLPGSGSGSHHSSNNSNNNNNTGTEAAAPEAAAPAPAASAPVTTTTSARTGDSSNLIGWLAVLLISGGAAGAWYTVAKKKKEQ